jgi:glycosyltransferase involved in cell wall biosynthesis
MEKAPFPLSVTIITLNEERNLARALKSVAWADDVVVIDSGSTDKTVEVARQHGARVIHNPWPGYGKQKNFAQESAKHDWVLNIDADEAVPESLREEIRVELEQVSEGKSQAKGFFFPRKTYYLGRWILHGGWYPNHLVRLADRRSARWTEPTVHEELAVQGEVRGLREPLEHFTFGSIQDQILTNLNFSKLGSQELIKRGQKPSLLKLLVKPVGKFLETYLIKKGFLDGLPGFIISVNAAHSMFLKYAYLIEAEITSRARADRR